jgi:AraC-like DNA-binding protein
MMWCWEGYHPPHSHERILPFGGVQLVVNLTDEGIWVAYPIDGFQPRPLRGVIVCGVHSSYFVVQTCRPASILSVVLEPGAACQLLGLPTQEFHNCHLPLSALWGREADDLYERLLTALTVSQRFAIMEAHLLARLQQAGQLHRAVPFALRSFCADAPAPSIARVVEQLALSPTRFIQVFEAAVGLTPKRFCQVQRFQRAFHMIARQPEPDWAAVALAVGYYDQAHFINEFHRFAGITPTQFAPQSAAHPGNLPFNDAG